MRESDYTYTVGILAGLAEPVVFDNESDALSDGATHLRQIKADSPLDAIRFYTEDVV